MNHALITRADSLPPLPAQLEQVGHNRTRDGRSQLQSTNDREAVFAWLANVADSPHTRDSYLREVDRLYRWAADVRGKPLSGLQHEDFVLYRQFLADPQPAARWIAVQRYPRSHPDWRPFAGPLGESSIRLAISILNALFSWLVDAGYLMANPLALSRNKRSGGQRRLTRLLGRVQIDAIFAFLDQQAQDTAGQRTHLARNRWLLTLTLLTGLRISEVTESKMRQIYRLTDADGRGLWYLDVTGKGSKARQVPVNSELLAALCSYRESLNLPPLPASNETGPLLAKVRCAPDAPPEQQHLTRQACHVVLKNLFRQVCSWLEQQGRQEDAQTLAEASAHWLRHTAASMMGDAGQSAHSIMATLGHADLGTTSIYLHRELSARHSDMEKHSIHQKG
ncbi:tyrosine-type recombinase/integrase [Craterilacuibacter sp.]|uniref:tyrosine-type recombinase/integrase n=1 Tax=Craterilacuibacter sp. TaxID=2870909 RepID=UPI003F2FDAA2